MRVVSGYLKARTFDAPRGHRTHPMGDKVRGALFNVLGDIEGLTILDAFTGSGAISIEAVSRGAQSAIAIDVDKGAITTVTNTLKQFGLEPKIKAIRASATSWSENNTDARFDIVVLDPPYDEVKPEILRALGQHTDVGGVLVVSLPPTVSVDFPSESFEHLVTKQYGDAKLYFYRRQ
jgi:16S rRNA (guanine966-N2)-methyltransferase